MHAILVGIIVFPGPMIMASYLEGYASVIQEEEIATKYLIGKRDNDTSRTPHCHRKIFIALNICGWRNKQAIDMHIPCLIDNISSFNYLGTYSNQNLFLCSV